MKRHDLLLLTERETGRLIPPDVLERLKACGPGRGAFLPGIVKRQEAFRSGYCQAGFSFPWFENGSRARMAALVRREEIVRRLTPFEAAGLWETAGEGEIWEAFARLRAAAGRNGLRLGIYGSTALQAVTGYPYLHEGSDLDAIAEAASLEEAEDFSRAAREALEPFGRRLDLEIRIPRLGDVKGAELLSGQRTIIVREIDSIFIFDRKKKKKI